MRRFFLICLGGAIGTGLRYLVNIWAAKTLGIAFPFGTLIVNVVGCFLIAAVMHVSLATTYVAPTFRLTLTAGFIGGLTTYSSFNYETTKLLQERAWGASLLYFASTAAICFAAGILGIATARSIVGSAN